MVESLNSEPTDPAETKPFSQECHWPWKSPDGTVLDAWEWPAEANPSSVSASRPAIVLAIHGLGGAGSDFRPLGASLSKQGVTVYAPDLRGQGNDPVVARRGNVGDLREVTRDLRAFVETLRERHPMTPLYLYGESMGAMLAFHLAAGWNPDPTRTNHTPVGLILASPVIAFETPLQGWRSAWFKLLVGVAPQFRLPLRGLPSRRGAAAEGPPRVTRDEAYTEVLRTAPHRLRHVTPRFLRSLLAMIQQCREVAPTLRLPVLMLYAGHDIFVRPPQVEAVYDLIGSPDKTRRLFADSYHLLLHDHDRDEVLEVIRRWMAANDQ